MTSRHVARSLVAHRFDRIDAQRKRSARVKALRIWGYFDALAPSGHRNTHRFNGLKVVVAFGLLLFAANANAAPDDYGTALARAVTLKEHALDVDVPSAWLETLEAFQQLEALGVTKETRYEIGFAAMRLDRYALAFQCFEQALELGLAGSARLKAEAFLAEHGQRMSRIEITGAEGTALFVDGEPRGELPLKRALVVLAGEVTLLAQQPGAPDVTRVLTLAPGESTSVQLQPTQQIPVAETTPPLASAAVEPPQSETPQPAMTILPQEPPLATSPSSTSAWVLIVSGAVTATASAILVPVSTLNLNDHRNHLRELCLLQPNSDECTTPNPGQRQTAQDAVDSIATWKALRTTSWIGVSVGAAALISGTVWLFGSSEQPHPTAVLVPLSGGGAEARAEFKF